MADINFLRYTRPADSWNEALPIGNGRLGAMLWGRTNEELIQMNEDSVWSGGSQKRLNPDARKALPKIQAFIASQKIREAESLALSALTSMPSSMRHYEMMGTLVLKFGHGEDADSAEASVISSGSELKIKPLSTNVSDYYRELDCNTAISKASYTYEGVKYRRESFVSAPAQLMVFHIAADQDSMITFQMRLMRISKRDNNCMDSIEQLKNGLLFTATVGRKDGVQLCCAARLNVVEGDVESIGDSVYVKNANAATILVGAETSFRHKDPRTECLDLLDQHLPLAYSELKTQHIEDYSSLFSRMQLRIGKQCSKLPTDERLLSTASENFDDQNLFALYFAYGRYLLLSSSREGSLPANLQGIWNEDIDPKWGSKYTINIKQMNYWLAETCNLSECHLVLLKFIEKIRHTGHVTAREMYNCRGIVAHHNTDMWADTAPQDRSARATYWPLGAAWLALHVWEHYEFLAIRFSRHV